MYGLTYAFYVSSDLAAIPWERTFCDSAASGWEVLREIKDPSRAALLFC